MADIQHSALTGNQLHEPKGVSAATVGQFGFSDTAVVEWDDTFLLTNDTPSSVDTVEFTNLGEYRQITLSFRELLHGTPAKWWMQFSSNNGSSYVNTNYHTVYNQNGTSASDSTHSVMSLAQNPIAYNNGTIVISNFNFALPTTVHGMISQSSAAGKTGSTDSYTLLGCQTAATAFNAIQIVTSTGTFTSGEVTLEGIRS